MPRNKLPTVMKHYSPTGRRNHGRPLKRFLDTWDWNGSTSGPTQWQIYDVCMYVHMYVCAHVCVYMPNVSIMISKPSVNYNDQYSGMFHCTLYVNILLLRHFNYFTVCYHSRMFCILSLLLFIFSLMCKS